MLKNRKQQHIGFFTPDMEKTVNWYVNELGFKAYESGLAKDLNISYTFVGSEDRSIMFEILHSNDAPELGSDGVLDHFCFDSQDIEADYAEAVKNGYEIITGGIIFIPEMWENGVKFFKYVTDTKQIVEFAQVL